MAAQVRPDDTKYILAVCAVRYGHLLIRLASVALHVAPPQTSRFITRGLVAIGAQITAAILRAALIVTNGSG